MTLTFLNENKCNLVPNKQFFYITMQLFVSNGFSFRKVLTNKVIIFRFKNYERFESY